MLYELYNTATEEVEAQQMMSSDEARELNDELRDGGDTARWICAGTEYDVDDNTLDAYE